MPKVKSIVINKNVEAMITSLMNEIKRPNPKINTDELKNKIRAVLQGKTLQEIREFLIGEDYHPDDIEEMASMVRLLDVEDEYEEMGGKSCKPKCTGGKTCCDGKCYAPDAEDHPPQKKCYQEADFEFGKEEEYEEVVTRAPRATKGCNVWVIGMQVYNWQKAKFGDIISSSDKNVTVKLYRRGKLTEKTDVWDCKDVSQTELTKKVNARRNLKKILRSTTIMRIKGKGRLKTQDGMKNEQIDTIEASVKGKRQNERGRIARESRESEERNMKNRKMIEEQGKYRSRTSGRKKSSRYQDLKF